MHDARQRRPLYPCLYTALTHHTGLPLYLASSMLLRHSLHAIYAPLTLTISSVRVSSTRPPTSNSGPPIPSLRPTHEKAYERQKSLTIGFDIDGRGRVGGKSAHWEVRSTYHFHPMHARIHRYVHILISLLFLYPLV